MSRPSGYPVGAYFAADNGDNHTVYVPRLPCPHNSAAEALTAEEWETSEQLKGDDE